MKTCCFFGHADTSDKIKPRLINEIEKLIINENVEQFYVGNHGNFDAIVLNALKKIKLQYPQIQYEIVLAYMPSTKNAHQSTDPTVYPDGLETVPKKLAIIFRNKWMAKNSDIAIVYINHTFGGAYNAYKTAQKHDVHIINIAS